MINKILVWLTNLFFRLLYHEFAWSYDLVAYLVSLGSWNKWVKLIANELNEPTILELGHGPGHLQKFLLENGKSVFGIDRSRQMGKLAIRRLRKHHLMANLSTADAQYMPFRSQTFDQITATFPTEYIVALATIKEIDRVLKPGGEIVILPSARLTGNKPVHRFIEWLYLITGQTGDQVEKFFSRGLTNYGQLGYRVTRRTLNTGKSELLVLNLVKPEQ